MNSTISYFLIFIFCAFVLFSIGARADEYTSTNFRVLDPVMTSGGSFSSSTDFQLFGAISRLAIGTSTITSFGINTGLFYYPYASSPVVSATAGNGQAALTWTASQGYLGWNVSGYNVGQSTTSGGPYAYSASLGNVTSSTRTSLTNGTAYYFIVRAEDAYGNSIATSTEVSATPVAPAVTPTPAVTPSGGGGGGGGSTAPLGTLFSLKGRAYPSAEITVFKDGAVIGTPKADANGNFRLDINVVGGLYTFSIYAIDSQNRRSITSSFTINVSSGLTTTVSDIVISPTIGADKSEVKIGNDIKFFGYTYPASQINVIINSENPIADKTNSDKFGYWAYDLNSEIVEMGDHTTKSQAITPDALKSPFSESLGFRVGDKDVLAGKLPSIFKPAAPVCSKKGDINNDGKINIVDFSILLYFWNQKKPSNTCADINVDGAVNLFDFSIMLYWWTG